MLCVDVHAANKVVYISSVLRSYFDTARGTQWLPAAECSPGQRRHTLGLRHPASHAHADADAGRPVRRPRLDKDRHQ